MNNLTGHNVGDLADRPYADTDTQSGKSAPVTTIVAAITNNARRQDPQGSATAASRPTGTASGTREVRQKVMSSTAVTSKAWST